MAEFLVASLLKLIPSCLGLLKREWDVAEAAEGELQDLKNLIEDIGNFLEEANSRKTVDNNLRVYKKRARRFIYDSQDVIDDYLRSENIPFEGLVARCYKQYSHRTFASEARYLRERMENYRPQIAMGTPDQSSTDHAQASSASPQSSSIAVCNETDDKLVGIKGPRDQLVRWLTDNNSMSKVIFVHGAQGVGKTSLVGAVLRDNKVKNYFKYYAWIEDYKLIETNRKVQMQANVEIWDPKENRREVVQLEQAFQFMENDPELRNNKCRWALVLDDVSKAQVITLLQDRLDPTRPSVLITTCVSSLETHAEKLASTSRTSVDSLRAQSAPESPNSLYGFHNFKRVFQFFSGLVSMFRAFLDSEGAQFGGKPPRLYDFHNFKHFCLPWEDSSALFCREMFPNDPSTALTEVSRSILVKCEGLPLAILATCEFLRPNRDGVNGNPPNVDWQTWNSRLGEELLSKENPGQLIRRMITLRMEQLRRAHGCLYYLSMFPLECHIRCSTLMRLWMAERFAMQEGSKTDQTIAEENLKEILDRNLVQEVERTSYGRVRICRLHSLLHEIIIKKSKDDDFAMIVANPTEVWPEIVWRLSFHSQMDHILDGTRVNRLRSLLIFKEVYPESMIRLLRQVDRLGVLHLEASSLNSFPRGVFNLTYLRYLKLRGSHVKEIPNDIGNLVHLETLDLKGTGISKLPPRIVKLQALRHLLVYRSDESPTAGTIPKHGVKVPLKLGVLTSLQKLCLIKLDEDEPSKFSKFFRQGRPVASLLEQLGELKHLQRLGISELKSTDMEPLCSSIEKLTELKALHLIAASEEILDLSRSRAHPSLQRVHLTGGLGALPNWILSCQRLTKLVLKARQLIGHSQSQLEGDQLQQLGELPYLKHLELEQAFDAPEMTFEAGKFQELRFLGLDRFDKLASLNVNEGALPTLEKLFLARCKLLTTAPQDIIHPRNLKCLELYEMPGQFMNAVGRDEEVRKRMEVVCKVWNKPEVEDIELPADRARRPSAAPASTD